MYFSPAIDERLRQRLLGDEPRTVRAAADLMSAHGPAADRDLLQARLARWLREWGGRRAELENGSAGMAEQADLQVSLIIALVRGVNWTLTDADIQALKAGCASAHCRAAFGG